MTSRPDSSIVADISDLKVHFPVRKGVFGGVAGVVKAVDGVSFKIRRGEIFALVGESGCGKTTTAQAVLGLVPKTSGRVALSVGDWKEKSVNWEDLTSMQKRELRKQIQVVFQDPFSSLDPRFTVRQVIEEPLIIHKICSGSKRAEIVKDLLNKVGLSDEYLNRYPHEFSGGQRQRICIARALATGPELIVADEPVSALDVSIQAQIINLLQDLQSTYNQTLLFISHDLAVVRHVANRLAVMYLGKIAESGTENHIFSSPRHPYTALLLESIPVPGKGRSNRGKVLSDDREKTGPENGCSFYSRCPRRIDECLQRCPELVDAGDNHLVACFNPLPVES